MPRNDRSCKAFVVALLVGAVLSWSVPCRADAVDLTLHPATRTLEPGDPHAAANLYQSGHRLRTAGIVLTIVGGVLFVGAMVFIVAGATEHSLAGDHCGDCGPAQTAFGVLLGLGSAATGITGAVLWTTGASRMQQARTAGYTSELPHPIALSWSWRF